MKTKNALKTTLWSIGLFKPNNIFLLPLLILLLLSGMSCKKDIINPKVNVPGSSNIIMKQISYDQFIRQIDLKSIGFLKPKLDIGKNAKGKLLALDNQNAFGNLAIYTDSLNTIINGGDTSYVFKMALTSKRAISFRNLTIQKGKGKTSAFITTYTPAKEWIDAWKLGRKIEFKGQVSFAPLNLEAANLKEALLFDNSTLAVGKQCLLI